MSTLSNDWRNGILDHVTLNGRFTGYITPYVGLLTAEPSPDGTYQEFEGNGYQRQLAGFYSAQLQTGSFTTNSIEISFPPASTSWGQFTHIGMFDAQTGGSLKWYAALPEPITININEKFFINKDRLRLAFE